MACSKLEAMIHYLENKVGVVDFANAQGLGTFQEVGHLLYYKWLISRVELRSLINYFNMLQEN